MSHTKRVLCIVPPGAKFVREDRCQTPIKKLKTVALRPPIDLMYCAASFESAGCEVKFRDYAAAELSWSQFEADLRDFVPTELVISVTTLSIDEDVNAAKLGKSALPNIRTIAVGAHFQTLDTDALERYPSLDVVLRGEYEHACRELGAGETLSAIKGITFRGEGGELVRNEKRPFEVDLDQIPFPARHLVDNSLYVRPDTGHAQTTVVTNRGCPFQCIYCLANQVAGLKNRYRSVENVIAELKECIEVHGIRDFLFRSELFTQSTSWVTSLCDAITREELDINWACNSRVDTLSPQLLQEMKRAGCWIIAFGVESGDQDALDRLQKKARVGDAFKAVKMARDAGIKSSIYLLIGLPWDTQESVAKQAEFARLLDPDFLEVFYPYPFPGTPLHTAAVNEGLIRAREIPQHAYSEPAMPGHHLTIEELKELRRKMLKQYYLRPRVIARTLKGIRTPREFVNYVRAGIGQMF